MDWIDMAQQFELMCFKDFVRMPDDDDDAVRIETCRNIK